MSVSWLETGFLSGTVQIHLSVALETVPNEYDRMHDSFDFHVVVLSLSTSNTTGILGNTVKGSIAFYNANNLVFHCPTFAWKFAANEADLQVLLR